MRSAFFVLALLLVPLLQGCPTRACDGDGDGFCAPDDCDDGDADIHPDAAEICNGVDDNCNGAMSDAEIRDADEDGVGECLDCNDNDPTVTAITEEVCDGIDNDCDGQLLPEETEDADGDGHPPCTDCDDADPDINPDAEEICDGIDNNCDGAMIWDDEAGNGETTDDDLDGICPCCGDCDDLNDNVYPGNYEYLTDGLDNDCDGQGDNKPLMSPKFDSVPNLELLMEAECEFHGRVPVTVTFDGGTDGDAIGGTSYDGFELYGDPTGAVDYEYDGNAPGYGPYDGDRFAYPSAAVTAATMRWNSPQTLVLFAIHGVTAGQSANYPADIWWDGVNLGGIASIFGTNDAAGDDWNYRGVWSFENVAFEELIIYSPIANGEFMSFDSVTFCE